MVTWCLRRPGLVVIITAPATYTRPATLKVQAAPATLDIPAPTGRATAPAASPMRTSRALAPTRRPGSASSAGTSDLLAME